MVGFQPRFVRESWTMLHALRPAPRAAGLALSFVLLLTLLAGCNSSDLTDPGTTAQSAGRPMLDTMRQLPSSSSFIVTPVAATGRQEKAIHFSAYTMSTSG